MTSVHDNMYYVNINANCTHTSQEIDYLENLMTEDHLSPSPSNQAKQLIKPLLV